MGKECTYHAYFTSRVSKVDILKPDGIKLQSLMGKKRKDKEYTVVLKQFFIVGKIIAELARAAEHHG